MNQNLTIGGSKNILAVMPNNTVTGLRL